MDPRFHPPKPPPTRLPPKRVGLPPKGATGEVLVKVGVADHITTWAELSDFYVPAGGTTDQVLAKDSNADYDVSFKTHEAFKVGGYYFNSTGVNPNTELGYGTWTQVAQGLILVGAP